MGEEEGEAQRSALRLHLLSVIILLRIKRTSIESPISWSIENERGDLEIGRRRMKGVTLNNCFLCCSIFVCNEALISFVVQTSDIIADGHHSLLWGLKNREEGEAAAGSGVQ